MRPLSGLLDDISSGQTARRSPAYRVEIYDVRSSSTTRINEIVAGLALDPIVGPMDVTDFSVSITIDEVSGDYATGGIASSTATIRFEDPTGAFDPYSIIADSSSPARFFRDGNVVRIYEGDNQVPEADWPNTFTMVIQGQVGYPRSRAVGSDGISQLTIRAVTREATFLGFVRTSREFTINETHRQIGESVAVDEMGLLLEEIAFSGWGTTTQLRHATLTLADESPLVMLARVMFYSGFLPKFRGDGKLTQQLALLPSGIGRFYDGKTLQILIGWPLANVQAADSVCVVGLDFNMARVDMPRQVVAEASVTTGYFTQDEAIDIYFSEDRTQLADDPRLVVLSSVNGGLTALGGGEVSEPIPAPNDTGGGSAAEGSIGMTVRISTGYAPWLSVFLLTTYAILAAVPDLVFTVGFIATTGATINVGGIAQAIALSAAMMIMTALGRGIYEISAIPFEYVFPEIRQCARVAGVSEFSENSLEILNHMVDEEAVAEDLAKRVLFLQQASRHPRNVDMFHDLAVEPGDVWSTLDDDRAYYVVNIRRTIVRGPAPSIAKLACYEVTTGISEAG